MDLDLRSSSSNKRKGICILLHLQYLIEKKSPAGRLARRPAVLFWRLARRPVVKKIANRFFFRYFFFLYNIVM